MNKVESAFNSGFVKESQAVNKIMKHPATWALGLGGLASGGTYGARKLHENDIIENAAMKNEEKEIKEKLKEEGYEPGTQEFKNKFQDEWSSSTITDTVSSGIIGGLGGAYLGSAVRGASKRGGGRSWGGRGRGGPGGGRGGAGRAGRRAGMGEDTARSKLDLTGNETAKQEVKQKFKQKAREYHPDVGGSEEKMKEINEAWDVIQDSDWFEKLSMAKQSYLKGFYEEVID